MHEFDGDTWKFKALEDYVAYKEISGLVNNDEATQAYVNAYRIDATDVEVFPPEHLTALRNQVTSTLRESLGHFACQTIISLCTTFEVTAREFFRAFFAASPATLFDFTGPEDAKGHVPLRDILQVSSHSELIARLADRASGVASKGKYGQVYGRAQALCSQAGDKDLMQSLNRLQSDRNRYIHERHRPNVGMKEVKDAHAVVDTAVERLCELAVMKQVPGRYTCVRPIMMLEVEDIAVLVNDEI